MLSHNIIVKEEKCISYANTSDTTYGAKRTVNSQAELDAYLNSHKEFKVGRFVCHQHITKLKSIFAVQYLLGVVTEFSDIERYDYMTGNPNCYYIGSLSKFDMEDAGDAPCFISSTSHDSFRLLTAEEIAELIGNDARIQNHIKRITAYFEKRKEQNNL